MAEAQVAARFMTEVAPPQLVTIMRRRKVPRSGLDTIAEDDRELQVAYSYHQAAAAAAAATTASASSLKRASPATASARAGGFMRELSSCLSSSNVVHGQAAAGGGGWENRHKEHGRRVAYAYAHQLHRKLTN